MVNLVVIDPVTGVATDIVMWLINKHNFVQEC